MNYFMGVPEDVIQSGILELYEDDDDTLVNAVRNFNNYETDCRIDHNKAESIFGKFCVMNLILMLIIILCKADNIFVNKALAITLLAGWVVVFFVFVLFRRQLILGAAFTAPLVLLDIMFLLFFILNALITFLYERLDRPMRDNPAYPRFSTVDIIYRRGKRAEFHDPSDRL